MSKIGTNLILLVVSSLIALLAAELAVRFSLPPPGLVRVNVPPGLLIEHPTSHYAYAPGFNGRVTTDDYSVEVEINAMGLREDSCRRWLITTRMSVGAATEVDLHQMGCATEDPARAWEHVNCRSCWVYFLTNLRSVLAGAADLRDRDHPHWNDSISIGWPPTTSAVGVL